jgi:hypothetical protein
MAEEDHDRMDCCDDDPRKVWVVVGAWSGRRAVLTHAAPFLAAAGTDDLPSLEGRDFLCRLDLNNPPPFEHEGGERLEWPDLRPAPPMSEVYARLGITPPEDADDAAREEQPAAAPDDTCRVVDIGGEPIRVHGSGQMSDESRAALAEVIGAARAKYVAEHPDAGPVISPRVAAHVLWQEGLGGYAAGSFTTALLKAWWMADPANSARLTRTWPEYGAAIALLGQPGGTEQLRAITGEQPTPDRS